MFKLSLHQRSQSYLQTLSEEGLRAVGGVWARRKYLTSEEDREDRGGTEKIRSEVEWGIRRAFAISELVAREPDRD